MIYDMERFWKRVQMPKTVWKSDQSARETSLRSDPSEIKWDIVRAGSNGLGTHFLVSPSHRFTPLVTPFYTSISGSNLLPRLSARSWSASATFSNGPCQQRSAFPDWQRDIWQKSASCNANYANLFSINFN